MGEKRIILEMGTSNDLYGDDYTKAAKRAVQDALRHSSITLFSTLGVDSAAMRVQVTIGVQKPEEVECDAVAETLPRGRAEVKAVLGGMNIHDPARPDSDGHVIATAAVEAFIEQDLLTSKWVVRG